MSRLLKTALATLTFVTCAPLWAQTQTTPGAGNTTAAQIAGASKIVQTAKEFLVNQAKTLADSKLRSETLDAISNPDTCVTHRAGLTDATKNAIFTTLKNQGLVRVSDDTTFPGGLKGGV